MLKQELGVIDRATLAAWRGLNEVGWTFATFFLAASAQLGLTVWLQSRSSIGHSAAFNLNQRPGGEEGVDDLIAKFGLRIGFTIMVALGIGWLIGRRVWRRQSLYAAIAGAAYAVYVILSLEFGAAGESSTIFGDGTELHRIYRTGWAGAVTYDLLVLATAPIAASIAGRVVRRRTEVPPALRDAFSRPARSGRGQARPKPGLERSGRRPMPPSRGSDRPPA